MSTVDIRPDHAKIVQDILEKFVPDNAVWVFGSRAKWLAKEHSDLDLCIMGDTPLTFITLGLLEEAFEDSDLPYKVDIVDWATTSPEFKKIIARDKVVFRTGQNKKMDKNLKEGWIETTLGAVVKFTSEKIALKNLRLKDYISTDNMLPDRSGVICADKFPSGEKVNAFLKTDTLFSNIRTYFRKVWYASFNGGCSADVLVFRSKNSQKIIPLFVYYIISSEEFIAHSVLTAKGVKMPRGDKTAIMQYNISLPPLAQQKKIASILKSLDDKIAINSQINQTLEAMAQAIFKSWFVDFDPVYAKKNVLEGGGTSEQANLAAMAVISGKSGAELEELKTGNPQAYNELAHTASLFPSDLQDSELGRIPSGWEVKPLGDVVTPKKGKNITKKTITIGNIPVVAGGLEPAYYHNQSNVPAPVVTISASGANAGFINLYYIDIWASDCSYVNNTQTNFVYTIYSLLKIRQSEIFGMQQGAAQPHIYPSDIMRIIITDAPKDIWKKCENTISLFYKMIGSNIQHSQTLSQIRDSLLPKLLSGEIDVGGVKEEIL